MNLTGWTWGDLRPLHYGVILADPPWSFEVYSEKGNNRGPAYDTMSMAQIMDLRVADLARSDCLLAMWVTDPMLEVGFRVLDAWGFQYATVGFYWAKTVRDVPGRLDPLGAHRDGIDDLFPMGTGYWTRANPEICLFARRGSPARLDASIPKLIVSERREHSRKPDCVHARLEALTAGPYCELFARRRLPGWDAWGNETGKFNAEERHDDGN